MRIDQLARATAAVLWADEKDTPEEWAAAERIFTDNGADWEVAKPLLEQELEALIDEDEDEAAEETEEDLDFGVIDLGPGVNQTIIHLLAPVAEMIGLRQHQYPANKFASIEGREFAFSRIKRSAIIRRR